MKKYSHFDDEIEQYNDPHDWLDILILITIALAIAIIVIEVII